MIDSGVITGQELDSIGFFPNTAVDRMVFDGTHNGKQGIEIGDAFELAIEKGKLPSPDFEPIKGAEYVDDLEMFLQRKIYIINCGHAISGYFGQAKGYTIAQDALRDPEIQQRVVNAVMKYTNQRTDEYGGSFENRYRFPAEIVRAIKTRCGEDFPVSLRYSVVSKTKGFREGALPGEEYAEVGRDMAAVYRFRKNIQIKL